MLGVSTHTRTRRTASRPCKTHTHTQPAKTTCERCVHMRMQHTHKQRTRTLIPLANWTSEESVLHLTLTLTLIPQLPVSVQLVRRNRFAYTYMCTHTTHPNPTHSATACCCEFRYSHTYRTYKNNKHIQTEVSKIQPRSRVRAICECRKTTAALVADKCVRIYLHPVLLLFSALRSPCRANFYFRFIIVDMYGAHVHKLILPTHTLPVSNFRLPNVCPGLIPIVSDR